MAHGTIRQLHDRGYGFIDQGSKENLFFHRSGLDGVMFDDLRMGDPVEFDTEPDPRGRGDRAVHVRKVAR
jgi:CspA family cold shock protein